MAEEQDPSSNDKTVDSITPTVDFGYQGSVPRSAGYVNARSGLDKTPPATESPAGTIRLPRKP